MGFSMELVKAKRRIKELEAEVTELRERLLPPEPPAIKGTIGRLQIVDLYQQIFPTGMDKLYISDLQYEITAISELRRFVDWDDTNIFPYVSEIHDCDDFALALAGDFAKYPEWSGFPVSFIWGDLYGGHAFCTCVAWKSLEDRTPTVYFMEPQNDHEIAAETVEDMELWLLPMRKVGAKIEGGEQ